MPLISGAKARTEKGFSQNVKREIEAGKPQKQAVAIAYSKARENQKDSTEMESSREYDTNGWYEIKGNPITKVGVFEYSGAQIDPSLEPTKIYRVYRPRSELDHEEVLKSFKLLPWIDDHAMLGSEEEGFLPAEKKGIHGVIGEDVYFDYPYMRGNLKVFSEKLAKFIQDGKRDLSIGYTCRYELTPGVFEGQPYDAIQRDIRGNHVALVDEGRSGRDVSVLDKKVYVFDSLEIKKMPHEEHKDINSGIEGVADNEDKILMAMQAIQEQLAVMHERIDALEGKKKEGMEEGLETEEAILKREEEGKALDPHESAFDEDEDEKKAEDSEKSDGTKSTGMAADAKTFKHILNHVSKRDSLARKLSYHIGTFDHSSFTLDEVARYGVKKLGLKVSHGEEIAAIEGYLLAANKFKNLSTVNKSSMDSGFSRNHGESYFDQFLTKGA